VEALRSGHQSLIVFLIQLLSGGSSFCGRVNDQNKFRFFLSYLLKDPCNSAPVNFFGGLGEVTCQGDAAFAENLAKSPGCSSRKGYPYHGVRSSAVTSGRHSFWGALAGVVEDTLHK